MRSVFNNQSALEAESKIISSLGIPSIVLMENAGKNSASFIFKYSQEKRIRNIYILTGKGNNAGDGFVIARHLANIGLDVNVIMLYNERQLKGDALINYNILINNKSPKIIINKISDLNDLKKCLKTSDSLFVDSVFGIGFKGELDTRLREIFHYLNAIIKRKIIAIDIVSGLDENYDLKDCVNADVTLSMGVKKYSELFNQGRLKSGDINVVNIGINANVFDKYNKEKMFEIEIDDIIGQLPNRNKNSHKYSAGKSFVLAGSPGFTGAAYLSSLSALRTGSGAVILGVPESLNNIMETKTTEVITNPLPETSDKTISEDAYSKIIEKIKWSDATLLGPGIGRNSETIKLLIKILKDARSNFVIDADALYAIKEKLDVLKLNPGKTILTPHYGEFSNLTGLSVDEIRKDLVNVSKSFARKYKIILVLKNAPTIITDGEYFYINSTGEENLATVGSGDVLSGIITGLYSQSKDPIRSAILGVYLHGSCGDELYREFGSTSTLAGDLIDKISSVKKSLS
jgi:ADP-dependent NAD(P)H-hydrate dehydratase / NAD(P)H-hydrate epimerase